MPNQNPEQLARDRIDAALTQSGWVIQDKKKINLSASLGVAVREYQTDTGPADYILFVDRKPVGAIEAKRPEEGSNLTRVVDHTEEYAVAKLKYLSNEKLSFSNEIN
jgi:type I restriction enzyme R subunit